MPTKDKIHWINEKGNEGVKVAKMAGQAIVAVACLTVVGVAAGVAGHLLGGDK